VILVDRNTIINLNRQFLDRNTATDVLAFDLRSNAPAVPSANREITIGEVYICLEVAQTAAQRYNTTLEYEVVLYAVHGLLHLADYDDQTPRQRRRMRRAEARVMTFLGAQISLSDMFEHTE